MLGFTDTISDLVQTLRVVELKLSMTFRQLLCVRVLFGMDIHRHLRTKLTSLANSTIVLSPLATFAVFVISSNVTGRELNTAQAYTALSLITLLGEPMNTLMRTIPNLNAAIACFDRIQTFMESDARRDHRLPLESPSTLISTDGDIEMSELSRTKSQPPIVITQSASFSWTEGAAPTIPDFTFTLLRRQFCFVIGPVGSGKSTLLKGLLGETPSSKGFVYSDSSRVAYVEQTPWIQNRTIQENILGVSSLDISWYNQVIHVCALEQDIAILPKGNGKFSEFNLLL